MCVFQYPQNGQERCDVESCCCAAGHVEVTLSLNKTGFVPGEPVLYDINIDNQSEKPVGTINLFLQQVCNGFSFFYFGQTNQPVTSYNTWLIQLLWYFERLVHVVVISSEPLCMLQKLMEVYGIRMQIFFIWHKWWSLTLHNHQFTQLTSINMLELRLAV